MSDAARFDPDSYHVSQSLGDEWESHPELDHIAARIRHLAVPIGVLIEDPSNVRLHPEDNLEGIRGSYAKYKQRVLLVVNQRTMVVEKGNGSLQSLRKAGFGFAAVLFVDDDPTTATGFAIADNRTAEQATWDLPALFDQLSALKEIDYDVPGVDQAFFDEIQAVVKGADFAGDGPTGNSTPAPEPQSLPKAAVSEPGRVYYLGPHRIMCGSSTDAGDVAELMGNEKVLLVCTDPPYGVAYQGGTKDKLSIQNDDLTMEQTEALWRDSLTLACAYSRDGGVVYAFTPTMPEQLSATLAGWRASGFLAKHMLVWNKDTLVLGRSDYQYKHEGIFYGWKPGAGHYFVDDRKQSTVLDAVRPKRNADHPTMKPVELVQRLVENSTKPGWRVYDPFTGSGTCLLACARSGREFRGMELDPRYVDVIRRRWGEWARAAGVDPGEDSL